MKNLLFWSNDQVGLLTGWPPQKATFLIGMAVIMIGFIGFLSCSQSPGSPIGHDGSGSPSGYASLAESSIAEPSILEPSIEKELIKIGFVGPLTGDAAVFGMVEKNAITLALEDLNFTMAGHAVNVIFEDGKCTGQGALTAAQKLIQEDGVDILFSDCSSETLGIAPLAEREKVLLITAYANNPSITQAGDYIFRTAHSDDEQAKLMVSTLRPRFKRVGMLYEESSYAQGLKEAFAAHNLAEGDAGLPALSFYSESFAQNSYDVQTQLVKILAKNPDAVILNPDTPSTGLSALKQLKQLGYPGQIIGNFFGGNSEVQKEPLAQGMIFFGDPILPDNRIKKELFEKYTARFGPPAFSYPLASRYDNLFILKQAVESVGTDPAKIKDYLYSMPPFSGALGTYTFDRNGDIVGVHPSVHRIVGGKDILFQQ